MRIWHKSIAIAVLCAHSAGGLRAATTSSDQARQAQWLVITAPAFRTALSPLIQKRQADGLAVTVVETTDVLGQEKRAEGNGPALQNYLRRFFGRTEGPNYVLLVGAAPAPKGVADQYVVPSLAGKTGRIQGQPSDYGYGLPNAEGMPLVAVGRFPGRTIEEIRGMVRKTLAFEQDRAPGGWRNRIVLLQGNPGGGGLAEMFVEQATGPRLQRLHPFYQLQAVSHSGASPFYLPTARLHNAAVGTVEQGQLFSLYLGHSDSSGLWSSGTYFMTRADWGNVKIPSGQGIFFTCGCFACRDGNEKEEAYGLAAMRNPGGPVAVIGASGESYAAPGLLAADGLLECCSKPPFPTRLADYWLAVQRGLSQGHIDSGTFTLYDQFDGSRGKVPLAVQRVEHLEMWMLLGDPALDLPLVPLEISVDAPGSVSPGATVTVSGTVPEYLEGARVQVLVERPVGSKPNGWEKLPPNSPESASVREQIAAENYRRANDYTVAAREAQANATRFQCALDLPAKLPWPKLVLRAVATKENRMALGVALVPVSQ